MWIVKHPNGEYIALTFWHKYQRTTSIADFAKRYNTKTAKKIRKDKKHLGWSIEKV